MSTIKRNVRVRALEGHSDIAEFLTKELAPMVLEMREELNRLSGESREVTASGGILRTDRVIVCNNAAPITLSLPAVASLSGRWLSLVLLVSDVTLQARAGEEISGGSSLLIAKSATDAATIYCDGVQYHVVSSVT